MRKKKEFKMTKEEAAFASALRIVDITIGNLSHAKIAYILALSIKEKSTQITIEEIANISHQVDAE